MEKDDIAKTTQEICLILLNDLYKEISSAFQKKRSLKVKEYLTNLIMIMKIIKPKDETVQALSLDKEDKKFIAFLMKNKDSLKEESSAES